MTKCKGCDDDVDDKDDSNDKKKNNEDDSNDEKKKNKKDPFPPDYFDKFECCKTVKDEIVRQLRKKLEEERLAEEKRKNEKKKHTNPRKFCWGCLTCCYRKKKNADGETEEDEDDEENEEKDENETRDEEKEEKLKERERRKRKKSLEKLFKACNFLYCGQDKNPDKKRRICRMGLDEYALDPEESSDSECVGFCPFDRPKGRKSKGGRGSNSTSRKERSCRPNEEPEDIGGRSCCTGGGNKKPSVPVRPPMNCQVPSCKYNRYTNQVVCKWKPDCSPYRAPCGIPT